MNYLLDTCVLSELIKKQPNPKVIQWILDVEEASLFISVLTIGELHKGIEKLPESKKKNKLHKWVIYNLKKRFENKIIDFDLQTATIGPVRRISSLEAICYEDCFFGPCSLNRLLNKTVTVLKNYVFK